MLYGEKKQEGSLRKNTCGKLITIQMIVMIFCFICMPAIAIHSVAMTLEKDISNVKLIHLINGDKRQAIQEDSSDAEHSFSSLKIPAKFSEFPNLHPLFVHFPIVLLLLAFFTQLTSFFIYRKPLNKVKTGYDRRDCRFPACIPPLIFILTVKFSL